VPGPGGRVRRLTILDERDDHAYRAVVSRLAPAIERRLGPGVLANRAVGRGAIATTRLEPWGAARTTLRAILRAVPAARRRPAIAVTDVRRCYASIAPQVVAEGLGRLGAPADAVADLDALLRRFRDEGVEGLPIGPDGSAIVANAVLVVADDALRSRGVAHLRWVDDVVIVARSARAARAALDAVRRSLAPLGLELHDAKTRVLDAPDEALTRSAAGAMSSAARPPAVA
jgi:hypothetical protein